MQNYYLFLSFITFYPKKIPNRRIFFIKSGYPLLFHMPTNAHSTNNSPKVWNFRDFLLSLPMNYVGQTRRQLYKKEGYWDVTPKIKRLSFPKRGKFQVDLQDGRSVTMPISAFPSLKKLPVKERENWYLMGGGVTWDSCPEVIHIEQILGNYKNYAHESA